MVKDAGEIALIKKASDASIAGQLAMMRASSGGWSKPRCNSLMLSAADSGPVAKSVATNATAAEDFKNVFIINVH